MDTHKFFKFCHAVFPRLFKNYCENILLRSTISINNMYSRSVYHTKGLYAWLAKSFFSISASFPKNVTTRDDWQSTRLLYGGHITKCHDWVLSQVMMHDIISGISRKLVTVIVSGLQREVSTLI